VLFAFTGIHLDYHRPSDDADRINYAGMARIADYLELIALDVIRRPDRPAYIAVRDTRPPRRTAAGAGGPSMASLGVMPDYGHEANDGLSLAGVREGGPAAQAGLKQGDRIVKMGDRAIGTIYDYMEIMNKHKPGDKVELILKRDGKDVKLSVTLGSRPRE
jgi:S1-C subfamily serine protease